jgi:flavin-dependent dehydrogenase
LVAGVVSKDLKSSSTREINGKIVVDASGHSSILRSKVPPDWRIQRTIKDDEVMACYREIRQLSTPIERAQYCKIYLDQTSAPGGYVWIFPKGENVVNVGLGVQMRANFPNPKKQLYDCVISKPFFAGSRVLSGGGGLVPTRRPLDCVVGDGFMLVGDSACQVNPIHGGGIGPSMTAGKLAAEVAIESLERGDFSTRALWPYNSSYMKAYGYKQAGLDLFRIFLQKIGNDLIDYGMENVLIKEEDVLKVTSGEELHLNVTEKAERMLRGLGKISLIIRLRELSLLMKEMKNYYTNYPSPDKYADWKTSVERFYVKAKAI